jgi:hypothetical protein
MHARATIFNHAFIQINKSPPQSLKMLHGLKAGHQELGLR